MTLLTLISQILLTVPLTIIVNYFNKIDNRRINRILIPTIYTIIVAALIPSIKTNIFLIVVFEFFIRNFYITNIVDEDSKITNSMFIIENIISIALSLFTYNYFISKVDTVIPDPENIKEFIWFLIIIYFASLYKVSSKDNKIKENQKKIKYRKEQIIMQYAKYKNIYSSCIKSKDEIINNLLYALIIHKNYKTPKVYRSIKAYIGAVTKKETSYGIMQVNSYNRLTDEESIKLVLKDFEKQLKNSKLKENEKIDKLLKEYSIEEKEDIKTIYNIIVDFSKK